MSESSIAFVFPGQGSQKVGMLADLAAEWSIVGETFAEASDAIGLDLWSLVSDGPQATLDLTENAQPALLTASFAVWRILESLGAPKPAVVAGHSLGEWSALVCAGVISFADAAKTVKLRGQYMQEAVPVGVGSMAAIIGLSDEDVESCCAKAEQGESVLAVNYNSPGQLVIAGHCAAVERAIELCKEAGAKRALPLSVSAPFHTPLMKPAADRLAEFLDGIQFSSPKIPVIHNVHAKAATDTENLKALMIEQIYSPVKWVSCVQSIARTPVSGVVECGPGKVLSGLIKRIDRQLATQNTDSVAAIKEIVS